jgi:predicted DNA-binding antitoxin AbrB/MazE fold protein
MPSEEEFVVTRSIEALYENGVLRPLEPLPGLADLSRVRVTVELSDERAHPLAGYVGTLPDEDAAEMLRVIEDEFERIDPDAWR